MEIDDDAAEARAQGWRTLAALHARIEDTLERTLQREHDLSVSEVQRAGRAGPPARLPPADEPAVQGRGVLSRSATTRLVTRLEQRGLLQRYLCPDDRRASTPSSPPRAEPRWSGRVRPMTPRWPTPYVKRRACRSWRPSSARSPRCPFGVRDTAESATGEEPCGGGRGRPRERRFRRPRAVFRAAVSERR
ncbi:MarR family transcriptional regulator [Nonomuraea dietziae]|uniref:MarR family transcriptional regulator n=1 Tax=Nonomuraea dietziae TaxID=65515 RepID=UPI003CD0873A